jgi:hypothetical protein
MALARASARSGDHATGPHRPLPRNCATASPPSQSPRQLPQRPSPIESRPARLRLQQRMYGVRRVKPTFVTAAPASPVTTPARRLHETKPTAAHLGTKWLHRLGSHARASCWHYLRTGRRLRNGRLGLTASKKALPSLLMWTWAARPLSSLVPLEKQPDLRQRRMLAEGHGQSAECQHRYRPTSQRPAHGGQSQPRPLGQRRHRPPPPSSGPVEILDGDWISTAHFPPRPALPRCTSARQSRSTCARSLLTRVLYWNGNRTSSDVEAP